MIDTNTIRDRIAHVTGLNPESIHVQVSSGSSGYADVPEEAAQRLDVGDIPGMEPKRGHVPLRGDRVRVKFRLVGEVS